MSMIIVVAARQCRASLAGWRGAGLVALWAVAVALAAWAGGAAALADRAAYAAGEAANDRAWTAWLAAYAGDPWRPVFLSAESPLVLQKPPAPARALAGGVEDVAGSWTGIAGYRVTELEGRKAELSPLGALAGSLDLAGLVAAAGALLAIALGHDAVSGERARGTLALHFTTPLGRGAFLAGKATGAVLAAWAALLPPLALAVAGLALAGALGGGAGGGTDGGAGRAIAFLAASALYLAFWAVAAVAASAASRDDATSFACLIAAWLLLALVVPKAALALAERAHPVPAPAQVEQGQAKVFADARALYRERLAAYRAAHGDAAPAGADAARLKVAYMDRIYAGLAPIAMDHAATVAARRAAFIRWAGVSPAFRYQQAAFALAGTDDARYRAFLDAADAAVRALRYAAETRAIAGRTGPPRRDELPALAFREPEGAAWGAAVARELAAIALALAIAALLAWLAFRRSDLRPLPS